MRIGEYQILRFAREANQGFYLADSDGEEVLLPRRQCPTGLQPDDTLKVFVYTDSEDRSIATTKRPYAAVGEFAKLRVVAVAEVGAFLDWGIDKDLFCPIREQEIRIREGEEYVVRIYLDEASQRVACTTKLGKFLRSDGEGLKPGQPVKIMVAERKPDRIGVIVDGHIRGSLFPDEWHGRLRVGDVRDAFVKSVRPDDHKVAVSLRPQGFQAVMGERDRLIEALRSSGGTLPVSDESPPEEIQVRFGLSKGSFKKLIGALYKEGILEIEPGRIRLKGGD